jgi:hypothetical protein
VQDVDGVPAIKDGYNPATWALDVTNSAAERRLGVDFADVYEGSSLYRWGGLCLLMSCHSMNSKLFPLQYPSKLLYM